MTSSDKNTALPRESWLSLTKEDALDPDLPIIDPHHHLWDFPDSFPRNKIPHFSSPFPHYQLPEILKDTGSGHNIVKTVFIECDSMYKKNGPSEMRCVGETEYIQGIAAQSAGGRYGNTAVAAGIVGTADLTLGSVVAAVLQAQIEASRNRFRGIRFRSTWDADPIVGKNVSNPHIHYDKKYREGFSQLQKFNLTYDAWLNFPQLASLKDLANAFPDVTIIDNHIGGLLGIGSYAGKHDEYFENWKKDIAALSECPNVFMKLGGCGMPRFGFGWNTQAQPPDSSVVAKKIAPYMMWCIEKFGTKRCMFESNFPVDKQSYSYTAIWNAFKRITKDFTPVERADLFHDTAERVYRLQE